MYLDLKKDKLREIVGKAFKKAGDIRKLAKIIKVPRSTLSSYHMESRPIKEENLEKVTSSSP